MLSMADRLAERLSDKVVLRQLLNEFTGRDCSGIGSSGGTVRRRGILVEQDPYAGPRVRQAIGRRRTALRLTGD